MIEVKNEKELINLLRVISSEAVSVSKRLTENTDPTTKNYLSQYARDEKIFGSLDEQEDEEPEGEEAPEEAPDAPEEEAEEDSIDSGVSFDSMTRAINTLRSGKSLKDSGVKKQAADYYDKLSESERKALLVFLEALSEIISGQTQGKDAQDPSDPPVSISFSPQEEEEGSEGSTQAPASDPSEEPSEEPSDEAGEDEEAEDTSPPIRVNEAQDLSQLRKKVRRMMLRG